MWSTFDVMFSFVVGGVFGAGVYALLDWLRP